MLSWLSANISTIIICIILATVIAAIIIKMVRDRKNGKSSCGCNCGHCSMSGACHNHNE